MQLLRFDHAMVGKESGPCLAISFYLDGHIMTYHSPRSGPLKHDITTLPRLGLIQASAIKIYYGLVSVRNDFGGKSIQG